MLRLQGRLVSTLRAGAAFPLATSSLFRCILLSTDTSSAQSVSKSNLVSTRGLTPSRTLEASRSTPNLTIPDRADTVHAFLARDLGLSKSYVASTVSRSARIFCVEVDKTVAPCVSQLRNIGLSTPEIARLLPLVPSVFVNTNHVSRLAFYMSLLGSFEKVHNAIRRNTSLLGSSIEDVVEPNIALLRQCGLTVRHIAQVLVIVPRLLAGTQERVKGVILRAEELGVPRSTPMFRHALVVAYSVGRDTANAKMELMRSLGLSSSQVAMAVAKMPSILSASEDRLRRGMDFLTKEVGMDMETIARSPAMLKFSIEGRLAPRLKVLKILKEKGLRGRNLAFYGVACLNDAQFIKRFVSPYEKSIPDLRAVYAADLLGKAPARAATS